MCAPYSPDRQPARLTDTRRQHLHSARRQESSVTAGELRSLASLPLAFLPGGKSFQPRTRGEEGNLHRQMVAMSPFSLFPLPAVSLPPGRNRPAWFFAAEALPSPPPLVLFPMLERLCPFLSPHSPPTRGTGWCRASVSASKPEGNIRRVPLVY